MTAVLRAVLLAALAAASVPAVAAGQKTSSDSLLRRIDLLERRTTDLEQRVRDLEALIKVEPSRNQPVPDARKWQDLANWRRLRRGMDMDEVRKLLGEPESVSGGAVTYWYWPSGRVYFMNDRLEGWSEPSR